jgi:hypothetical protein
LRSLIIGNRNRFIGDNNTGMEFGFTFCLFKNCCW